MIFFKSRVVTNTQKINSAKAVISSAKQFADKKYMFADIKKQ